MKRFLIALAALYTLLSLSCYSQRKTMHLPDISEIPNDTFPVEDFKKASNGFQQQVSEDENSKLSRFWDNYDKEYTELIKEKVKHLNLFKRYYPSGSLKEKGYSYDLGSFRIGTWYYYDTAGKLTHTKDYEAEHKVGWQQALDYARSYYGYRQENLNIRLTGEEWFLVNFQGKNRYEGIAVHTKTGARRRISVTPVY